jgi:hypothetical protein
LHVSSRFSNRFFTSKASPINETKEEKERNDMDRSTTEETYWREHHASQPYADKQRSYEDYAPAYRFGYDAATKHTGKRFEEIEEDVALNYEKSRPESALPWDHARPAVKAAWDRLAGVLGPRDADRGIRSGM